MNPPINRRDSWYIKAAAPLAVLLPYCFRGGAPRRHDWAEPFMSTLARLRQKIDSLDQSLHETLIARAAASAEIARAKTLAAAAPARAFRPAREALIARALLRRHQGVLPPERLLSIWRQIIAASLAQQESAPLILYAPQTGLPDWLRLAYDYAGTGETIALAQSAADVLAALEAAPLTLALTAEPRAAQDLWQTGWWRSWPQDCAVVGRWPLAEKEPGLWILARGVEQNLPPETRGQMTEVFSLALPESAPDPAAAKRLAKAGELSLFAAPASLAAQMRAKWPYNVRTLGRYVSGENQ